MHRGLRPLGAGAFPPQGSDSKDKDDAINSTNICGSISGRGKGSQEGSNAAAKIVEGFIRTNIEAYFGCWASTYTLFSLDPRLVSLFHVESLVKELRGLGLEHVVLNGGRGDGYGRSGCGIFVVAGGGGVSR